MKKTFFILTIFCLSFIGCSKDDNHSPSLVGTSWEQLNGSVSVKLTFQTKIDCQILISSTEITNAHTLNYTYEHEGTNVRMYPKQSGNAELRGLISGQTMNVLNVSTSKTAYVLTKK